MRVIIVKDAEQMSARAAQIVVDAIKAKPDLILGLATGSTPEGLYAKMAEAHKNDGLDFSQVKSYNLDEYVGLSPDHDQSYRYFMNDKLFDHINIDKANTFVPDGLTEPLNEGCAAYEKMIAEAGGIDIQVLGIGSDGHMAFNEPGTSLGSRTHVTALTRETIDDNSRFFASEADVPRFAVTMGIGSIMEARLCLLMINGAKKAGVTRAAIEGPVTSMVTASALQLHPDTVAIIDEGAASELELIDFYRWQEENWHMVADKL